MGSFQLIFDGMPADDQLLDVMGPLEIEENADCQARFSRRCPSTAMVLASLPS